MLFFFNDTATTEIYTLSLHDALPIYPALRPDPASHRLTAARSDRRAHPAALRDGEQHPRDDARRMDHRRGADRKSTRLNSSHANMSYAVFCLKKKGD